MSYTLDVNFQNHTSIYVLDSYIINEKNQNYNDGLTPFVMVFHCNIQEQVRCHLSF